MKLRRRAFEVGMVVAILLTIGVSQLDAQTVVTLQSLSRRLDRAIEYLNNVERHFDRKRAEVDARLERIERRLGITPIPPTRTRIGATSTPTRILLTPTPTRLRPTSTPVATTPHLVTIRKMNVRSGPNTRFNAVGVVEGGETFEITGKNLSGDWWRIDYEGQSAWIHAAYVEAKNADRIVAVPTPALRPTPTPSAQVSVETYALALIKLDYEVIDSSKWRRASQEDRDRVVRTIMRLLIATAAYCDMEVSEVSTLLNNYGDYLERLGFASRNEYAPRINLLVLFSQKYVDYGVRRTDSCEEMLDGEVERVLREVGQ